MFLTRISVYHPVFATMIMVALVVLGLFSYQRLPVEQYPNIDVPIIAVSVSYPGASPQAVENDIVKPIEEAVATTSGLSKIQSTAQSGSATITISYKLEVNSAEALQSVRDRLASIESTLPAAAKKPQVFRYDPATTPILSFALSSPTRSLPELTIIARDQIVNRLRNVAGVGSVIVVGGVAMQVNVAIDPVRLEAFGVSVSAVSDAIAANNADLPAGSIKQGASVTSIQVQGKLATVDQFKRIIVARQNGQPVHLGDVAEVTQSGAEATSLAFLNGERALAINILKVQGANTVQVARDVEAAIARLQDGILPADVTAEVITNSAGPIQQSLNSVQNMLVEGALLSVVIVFLFLNSWRSTVITGLTLPISIIGTLSVLSFFGFTLNMMTLMALSLSVGILIDDAIVVRENIMRHLHMGKSHVQAALEGTKEIGLAVLATTLSIVAVFLPVAFMEGIMGRFFLQFGVTVSVAVMFSLLVAFVLDPMLSSLWYDPAADPNAKRGPIGRAIQRFDRLFEKIADAYSWLLRICLRHRIATLALTGVLFASSFTLVPQVGVEFSPSVDTGTVYVQLKAPPGSSLDYVSAKALQADALIKAVPEVERTYTTVGGSEFLSDGGVNISVQLVSRDHRQKSAKEVSDILRDQLASLPGLTIVVSSGEGMGGGGKPVQIVIYGDDLDTLKRIGDQTVVQLKAMPGLEDVSSSLVAAQPMLGIRVDPELATSLGITPQQISSALTPLLAGQNVSKWTSPEGKTYDLVVRMDEAARNNVEILADLPVGVSLNGTTVRLGQIASIVNSQGPAEILREGLTRRVTVDANLSATAPGDILSQVTRFTQQLQLPEGYRVGTAGEAESLEETGASALSALLMAVIFIYLVLASQFGSFLQPIAIMVSLPLSLVGVILGLLIGGSTLNMMSMIGFIMLMGLVVKNAILLVDNANQQVREGANLFDALVIAGHVRFRPIVMTTLAMILGMLPLALNLHHGSGENAPMAHAVIGGLISSTLLTLVVVPVILTYIDGLRRQVQRLLPKAPAGHAELPAA